MTLADRDYVIGYESCHCEGASKDRIARLKAEEDRRKMAEQKQREMRYAAAGIPPRYWANHDNFAKAQAMVREILGGDRGYYITGNRGTGKTDLAMAMARELVDIDQGKVLVVIVPDLMEDMRSRDAEDRERTKTLARIPYLVLDDLGKENPTPYACERLFWLINERYNNLLPTVITSNLKTSEIAARLTDGKAGPAIASRLAEMCKQVALNGPDRRLANDR